MIIIGDVQGFRPDATEKNKPNDTHHHYDAKRIIPIRHARTSREDFVTYSALNATKIPPKLE